VLNELAVASNVGIEFEEEKVPVRPAVNAACEMLGLDPFYIANEGKLVTFVPREQAENTLMAMRKHEFGKDAAIIGHVTEEHPGRVVAKTAIGSSRVVDLPAGELLPRIC
jgi:hydrogenase expression/formation protein HypE